MAKFRLSFEQTAELRQQQRNLHDTLKEIDLAEQCGIECQEYRQLHAEINQRITKLLTHYAVDAPQ